MSEWDYDLIIIGGGPAGLTAVSRPAGPVSKPCSWKSSYTVGR